MKSINPVRGFRLLALCVAVITFSACGQQEQAATEAVDESADSAAPVKIPVTTSSTEALELFTQGRALADHLLNVRAHA